MKVAITGATGFIGKALNAALRERGDSVVAFSRHPSRVESDLPGATAAAWPPEPAAFAGVDAVVHLAGESVAGRWTDDKKKAIRATREQGTRTLVDAIQGATERPKALLSASAIGYYGNRGDESLTETSTPGSDFLAEVCVAWEREAMRAGEIGLRVAALRTGVVLDAEGGALKQMLLPFKLGAGGPIGDGRQWFSWIHRDDIVGLYLFLLDNELSGPVNGTAPNPVRQGEFAKELGAALHRPAFLPTPKLALKLMYGEFAQTLFDSQRVMPEKAQAAGYAFRYPRVSEAIHAALEIAPPMAAAAAG